MNRSILAGAAALLVIVLGVSYWTSRLSERPPSEAAAFASLDDLITVTAPLRGASISSPLTITGKARGNWYFEASFPVTLLDANGKVLTQAPVQAQGEWMTREYVPFSSSLPFPMPATASGTLVLKNDNPTGLPQYDKELRIPVTFAETASSTGR